MDSAKFDFISLASHQLRSPATTVKWYTSMLLSGGAGKLRGQQKKYLLEIETANQKMIDLITTLINVYRIEHDTFSIEPKPTDLTRALQNVLNTLSTQIKKKELKIEEELTKTLPPISVDPDLIQIILHNLTSNAIKYNQKGGRITISIKKEDKDLILMISDTGCGIPKEQQSKIYDKLFRASNAKNIDPSGTGLNLYIVKSIIEKVGGKMWFSSPGGEENKGTTFYVSLPIDGMKEKPGTVRLDTYGKSY